MLVLTEMYYDQHRIAQEAQAEKEKQNNELNKVFDSEDFKYRQKFEQEQKIKLEMEDKLLAANQ